MRPLSPPTELEANRPPFLTASFSSATAAVEPGADRSMPSILRISPRCRRWSAWAPAKGRRSRTPPPVQRPPRAPISSPARVTRKLVILISSAKSPSVASIPAPSRRFSAADHAGAGNADVHRRLGFADSHVGTGHERVVLGNVRKHHQLGAAESAAVSRP